MASTKVHVSEEVQRAAVGLFEKYRTNECRQQHASTCRPQSAPGKYAVGDKVGTSSSERTVKAEFWCLVASVTETRCFSVGEKNQSCPVLLLPVSMAGSRIIDHTKFLEVKSINLRPPPLYILGTSLLISGNNGSESEVTIDGCFWGPKCYGGPSWKYKFLDRGDDWMPEHLLLPKVIKVLSGGCAVEPEPAQQTDSAGQKDATTPAAAVSQAEKHGPGGGSNVLLEQASRYTNEAHDLIKRAAAAKRSAAQLEQDEADKVGVQMQHLDKARDELWGKIAFIKSQKDRLTAKRSDQNERAAQLIKEAKDMESLLETGALRSVAAGSSTELARQAKRQRSE